jgi:hypothetical protein
MYDVEIEVHAKQFLSILSCYLWPTYDTVQTPGHPKSQQHNTRSVSPRTVLHKRHEHGQ